MKITKEHYEYLENQMVKVIKEKTGFTIEQALNEARKSPNNLSDKAIRWYLLNGCGLTPFVCQTLYKYLNDSHIDTALRKITNTK